MLNNTYYVDYDLDGDLTLFVKLKCVEYTLACKRALRNPIRNPKAQKMNRRALIGIAEDLNIMNIVPKKAADGSYYFISMDDDLERTTVYKPEVGFKTCTQSKNVAGKIVETAWEDGCPYLSDRALYALEDIIINHHNASKVFNTNFEISDEQIVSQPKTRRLNDGTVVFFDTIPHPELVATSIVSFKTSVLKTGGPIQYWYVSVQDAKDRSAKEFLDWLHTSFITKTGRVLRANIGKLKLYNIDSALSERVVTGVDIYNALNQLLNDSADGSYHAISYATRHGVAKGFSTVEAFLNAQSKNEKHEHFTGGAFLCNVPLRVGTDDSLARVLKDWISAIRGTEGTVYEGKNVIQKEMIKMHDCDTAVIMPTNFVVFNWVSLIEQYLEKFPTIEHSQSVSMELPNNGHLDIDLQVTEKKRSYTVTVYNGEDFVVNTISTQAETGATADSIVYNTLHHFIMSAFE